MMDSFLSIWPKGLFGLNAGGMDTTASEASSLMLVEDENGRKRARPEQDIGDENTRDRDAREGSNSSGSRTPGLLSSPRQRSEENQEEDDSSIRPTKRFRGERTVIPITPTAQSRKEKKRAPVSPLSKLPDDVLAHCLSFLGGVENRFALQCTSKQFRKVSNSDEMMKNIQVGGDRQTGLHGIIQEHDTPESATKNLNPFVQAGNLEAIYMLGIVKSYCHQDVEAGIHLLKDASSKGYTRASYALGLALRDSKPEEASMYMKDAADKGYIPALQELLPARKMKAKYGEPKADELRLHLDPLCLNRLLSRHYVQSAELREVNTSHCWNPLCGRWAFKATVNPAGTNERTRRIMDFSFRRGSETSTSSVSDNSTLSDTDTVSSAGTPTSASGTTSSSSKDVRVSRMKMCSRCCRAKYCSKLCQVYDWRSGRHKMECQFL